MMDPATITPNPLPKTLPGVVCVQWVRCGKPNCHCVRGERHKAHYRFWRERGRLRKAYVSSIDVERVRKACQARLEERQAFLRFMEEWRELVSRIREQERQQ